MKSSNIHQIDNYRPHIHGDCVCQSCGAEHVFVIPVGAELDHMECPYCGEFNCEAYGGEAHV